MEYPATMDELVERIRVSRDELEALTASVPADGFERESANGWSVRQQLLHLAAWESSVVGVLRGEPRGPAMRLDPVEFAGDWTADSINDRLLAIHGDMPLAEVLAWFAEAHAQLLRQLATMSDADLQRPYDSFMSDQPGVDAPIIRWVAGDSYEHFDEHIALLR